MSYCRLEVQSVKGFGDFLDNQPRVKNWPSSRRLVQWINGRREVSSCVQSQVPPTRRSTLQSVNWSTKHRRVKSLFYIPHLHSVLQLLQSYDSLQSLQCF